MPDRSGAPTANELRILQRANATLEVVKKSQSHSKTILKLINDVDIFYGVFPDRKISRGWDYYIIKGQSILASIASGTTSREVSWNAVTLECVEEAIALQQALGEPADSSGHTVN